MGVAVFIAEVPLISPDIHHGIQEDLTMLNQDHKEENMKEKTSSSVVGAVTNLKDKATPGPWEIKGPSSGKLKGMDDGGDYAIIAANQIIAEIICRTDETVYQPAHANARLIAASPNLLEACREAAETIGAMGNEQGGIYPVLNLLMNVIAKAEGK